ncbi:MAG: STT3 domain-containing protein [Pseudodesulfovibrio sp.]
MEALKKLYGRALDGIGDTGSFKSDWRWVLLYSLCVYAAVLALRLSFAGRWDHPELWVNGERIMATHDAYFWLAKAKGVGGGYGAYPLAHIAANLSSFFGVGLGAVGFWMPAYVGAMAGVVCFLWGWLLGGRNAGIFAGLAGALTPGFFYRSRLGYYDTDMFTLTVPLLVTWMLAYWSARHLRRGWLPVREEVHGAGSASLWLPFGFGICARVLGSPHQDIVQFNLLCSLMAVVVLVVGCRPGQRIKALYGLTVFWLAAFPGSSYGMLHLWPVNVLAKGVQAVTLPTLETACSIALAAGLAGAYGLASRRDRNVLENRRVFGVVMVVSCFLALMMVSIPLSWSWGKLIGYFSPGLPVEEGVQEPMGPTYPSIVQSIIEARKVPLGEILSRGSFSASVGYLSLAATVVVVVLRPVAVFMLPLVLLHLLSIRLGVRFTMFGGGALVVFLGVAIYWLCRWSAAGAAKRDILAGAVQVVMGAAVLAYCYVSYSSLPLTPVISRQHAEALMELGKQERGNADVWTWWDWGYATQYFAERTTVVDGGRHAGRDVYPVGFVLSSDSPETANHMVAFCAQYPAGNNTFLAPYQAWDSVPRSEIDKTLGEQLSKRNYPPTRPQYLVVSWKDLLIAQWVTYFGNWDLQTGTTKQASVGVFQPGQLGINPQRGAVMNRKGGGGLVKDIVMLDQDGAHAQHYFMNSMSPQLMPSQQHLVVNKVTGESVLMDRTAYRSMMVRLLVDDPADPEIARYFKLVVDKLPFARIYEVVQNVN